MPDRMPDRMPEDMSDRMPEDLPVTKCINVMVGITRSKVIYLFLFSKSFISLPPSFFNSYIRLVYLFLSFRAVHFVILLSFSF